MSEHKALVIGMRYYEHRPEVTSASTDAGVMSGLLERNADGSDNFDVQTLISEERAPIDADRLINAIHELFEDTAGHEVFLYFSGHAEANDFGFHLLTSEKSGEWDLGVSFDTVMHYANSADSAIVTIVLDCCFSGDALNVAQLGSAFDLSLLRENVSVLAASRRDKEALYAEEGELSPYTAKLAQGLEGAAANMFGSITAIDLHRLAADTARADQPVVFKAHVSNHTPIRRVAPRVGRDELRGMLDAFADETDPHPESELGLEHDGLRSMAILGLVQEADEGAYLLTQRGRYWHRHLSAGS